jgi:hypothetical protein
MWRVNCQVHDERLFPLSPSGFFFESWGVWTSQEVKHAAFGINLSSSLFAFNRSIIFYIYFEKQRLLAARNCVICFPRRQTGISSSHHLRSRVHHLPSATMYSLDDVHIHSGIPGKTLPLKVTPLSGTHSNIL